MEIFKKKLITAPILIILNYNPGIKIIIVSTDSYGINFGNTLKQIIDNVKHLIRYKDCYLERNNFKL